jgi:hypothetical protein
MTAEGSKRGARVLSLALLVALGAYLADRVMLFTTPTPRLSLELTASPGASASLRPAAAPADPSLWHHSGALRRRSGGECAGNPPRPNAPRTLQRQQRIQRPNLRRRRAAAALFRRGLPTWGSGARGGPKGSGASPTPGPARGPPFSEGRSCRRLSCPGHGPLRRRRRTLRPPADPAWSSGYAPAPGR